MSRSSDNLIFARRWASFVAAICLMQFSGTYGFANYSTALKEALSLNQVQLNRLSVAKDIGDACGIITGIVSNYIPAWALLTIGATVGFLGFGTQWLVVSGTINPLPYWTMFLAALVAGNSVSWINVATLTVSVRNFPRNRGPVVGLFKAYMGLSAAIFSKFCDYLFSSSASMYLLMLTIIPPSVCIISAVFIRPLPPSETEEEETEERRSMFLFNAIAISLAIYLAVLNFFSLSTGVARNVVLGVLCCILAAPLFVPVHLFFRIKAVANVARGYARSTDEESRSEETGAREGKLDLNGESLRAPLLLKYSSEELLFVSGRDHTTEASNSSHNENISGSGRACCCLEPLPELGQDRTAFQLLRSWDCIVLYFSLFCGSGSGMTFVNNLGQIGQSIGFQSVTLFTSFFSIGNFCGRIASGNVSEYFLRTAAVPRSVWMGAAKLPMIAMFLWLSTGSQTSLYAGSVVLGLCHGLHITLVIPIVSEFYGLKNFGTNFVVTNTHLLAGSLLFSGVLAGTLYDLQASKLATALIRWFMGGESITLQDLQTSDETLTCYGAKCYKLTFIILAIFLIVGSGLDGTLAFVSRPLYRKFQKINTSVPEEKTHDMKK